MVPWTPEASEADRLRHEFRMAMSWAFFERPSGPNAAVNRAERILTGIHNWSSLHKERHDVRACHVVLRGRSIDVFVFHPLREFDPAFAAEVSNLVSTLGELGVYASVIPVGVDYAVGETPEGVENGGGDPVMVILQ